MAQLDIQAALFLIAPLHLKQVLECIGNVDLSQLRQFFEKYGAFRQMKKKGLFVSQNSEELFIQIYGRMISLHCETAEERYMSLIKQCSGILNILTLKEIVLYLPVTPETVQPYTKENAK